MIDDFLQNVMPADESRQKLPPRSVTICGRVQEILKERRSKLPPFVLYHLHSCEVCRKYQQT